MRRNRKEKVFGTLLMFQKIDVNVNDFFIILALIFSLKSFAHFYSFQGFFSSIVYKVLFRMYTTTFNCFL